MVFHHLKRYRSRLLMMWTLSRQSLAQRKFPNMITRWIRWRWNQNRSHNSRQRCFISTIFSSNNPAQHEVSCKVMSSVKILLTCSFNCNFRQSSEYSTKSWSTFRPTTAASTVGIPRPTATITTTTATTTASARAPSAARFERWRLKQ